MPAPNQGPLLRPQELSPIAASLPSKWMDPIDLAGLRSPFRPLRSLFGVFATAPFGFRWPAQPGPVPLPTLFVVLDTPSKPFVPLPLACLKIPVPFPLDPVCALSRPATVHWLPRRSRFRPRYPTEATKPP